MAGGAMMDFGQGFIDRFGKNYKQGDIIFCEYEPGSTFYFLLSGRVKITKISSDTEKILDILEPGEMFGEMAILEEAPRSATIVALDDVRVLEFNKSNFESLMTAKPELAIILLKMFTKRIYDQKRRLKILILPDDESKIADVFLMLAENKNVNIDEVQSITFEITPEQVANWCGMDKMKCKEVLTHFAKQNRIVVKPNEITVTNIYDIYRLVNAKRKLASLK